MPHTIYAKYVNSQSKEASTNKTYTCPCIEDGKYVNDGDTTQQTVAATGGTVYSDNWIAYEYWKSGTTCSSRSSTYSISLNVTMGTDTAVTLSSSYLAKVRHPTTGAIVTGKYKVACLVHPNTSVNSRTIKYQVVSNNPNLNFTSDTVTIVQEGQEQYEVYLINTPETLTIGQTAGSDVTHTVTSYYTLNGGTAQALAPTASIDDTTNFSVEVIHISGNDYAIQVNALKDADYDSDRDASITVTSTYSSITKNVYFDVKQEGKESTYTVYCSGEATSLITGQGSGSSVTKYVTSYYQVNGGDKTALTPTGSVDASQYFEVKIEKSATTLDPYRYKVTVTTKQDCEPDNYHQGTVTVTANYENKKSAKFMFGVSQPMDTLLTYWGYTITPTSLSWGATDNSSKSITCQNKSYYYYKYSSDDPGSTPNVEFSLESVTGGFSSSSSFRVTPPGDSFSAASGTLTINITYDGKTETKTISLSKAAKDDSTTYYLFIPNTPNFSVNPCVDDVNYHGGVASYYYTASDSTHRKAGLTATTSAGLSVEIKNLNDAGIGGFAYYTNTAIATEARTHTVTFTQTGSGETVTKEVRISARGTHFSYTISNLSVTCNDSAYNIGTDATQCSIGLNHKDLVEYYVYDCDNSAYKAITKDWITNVVATSSSNSFTVDKMSGDNFNWLVTGQSSPLSDLSTTITFTPSSNDGTQLSPFSVTVTQTAIQFKPMNFTLLFNVYAKIPYSDGHMKTGDLTMDISTGIFNVVSGKQLTYKLKFNASEIRPVESTTSYKIYSQSFKIHSDDYRFESEVKVSNSSLTNMTWINNGTGLGHNCPNQVTFPYEERISFEDQSNQRIFNIYVSFSI